MLANVALTFLDNEIAKRYTPQGKGMNPIVRYADDFIVIAKSKEEAHNNKRTHQNILT